MSCYVMLCYVMLGAVMLCYVVLWYFIVCYGMLCYMMLCCVMSYGAVEDDDGVGAAPSASAFRMKDGLQGAFGFVAACSSS